MSVVLQLRLFSILAITAGIILLVRPAWILRSPLEPTLRAWTGLPSTPLEPHILAISAIPILAIGLIYSAVIITGDEKFVRVSVPGRLILGVLSVYLLLFTELGSTGLFMIAVADLIFAVWLGATIGFGGGRRGTFPDFSKKVD